MIAGTNDLLTKGLMFQVLFLFHDFLQRSSECLKSIKNYEKIMLGTSDAWLTSHSSQQPSKPEYYILDCWIFAVLVSEQ